MNPFAQPKNYSEMLMKVMTFTFGVSLVLVALVAHSWPSFWNLLHPNWLTFSIEVLGLKNIAPAYLIVAFLISLATRVSKLHDKISDVLKIRERFDINEIMVPLAGGTGIPVDLAKRNRLVISRAEIMGEVFYKYVSSTNPVIDGHLIWTALDIWSWFWISIESTTVGTAAFIALLWNHAFQSAAYVGMLIIVGVLAATQVNRFCASAAHAEVRSILQDAQRRKDVGLALNAV